MINSATSEHETEKLSVLQIAVNLRHFTVFVLTVHFILVTEIRLNLSIHIHF